jgi:endonuclease/exonuclease/phosphatase family metal-dependent hydrolase
MLIRRTLAIAGSAVMVGAATLAVSFAPPAGASSTELGTPTGMHVVAVTSSALTVRLHAAANAKKYRLYVSSVKSDLFFSNLYKPSKHRWSATASQPRIRLSGLKYSTKPYYYRVAALEGSQLRLSSTFPAAYLRPAAPTSPRALSGSSGTFLTWRSGPATGSIVEQATDSSFRHGLRKYRVRGPERIFTPYGLTKGTTYYFRVRSMNAVTSSTESPTVSTTVGSGESPLRVTTYNSLDASFDGQMHPGGRSAPFSQRRPGQLALLKRSNADVIGIQEGNSCLKRIKGKQCYRQIDSLARGLRSDYKLANTVASSAGPNAYAGNYILYKPSTVTPVGAGGNWLIGPNNEERFATYQLFRTKSTGATFLFVTTHLMAPRGAKWDALRGSETESMIRQTRAYADQVGVSAILYTGDFNSYRNEWHVDDVTGSDMLAAGIPDGIDVAQSLTNAKYDSVNALYRVAKKGHGSYDHVYATGGIGVRSWGELLNLSHGRFVGTIPSDHNPVVSTVEIPY